MANDPISQMVADPDFVKMQVSEQRKALAAHDQSFRQMADGEITKFVSAHQQQPQAQFQPPDATAQARQAIQNIPQFTSPTDALRANLSNAQEGIGPQGKAYNEYQRQSGQLAGQTAAGMATGGLLPAIKGAGLASNFLRLLGRTGISGASMGAGTLAGGGTPQEAKGAAEGGAIGQPIAEGVGAALPWMAKGLKNAATSQYQRALSPTTKVAKATTQKITPELIDRGVHGSLENIGEQAGQQAKALRPQLDTAYGATPASATVGSGVQIVQDLENLKGKYTVQGTPANPAAVNAISGVQDVVKQYGDDIAPDSLRKLKQIFDDPVAARGGYAGADLTTAYTLKAQKAAANSIRGIMEQANPDVASLNKEISFWLDVQRVTSQTAQRRAGQEGGLLRVLSPLGAGGAASAAGLHYGAAASVEAGAGTALTAMAIQAMRSPAWRTASAVFKDRMANALASGDVSAVSGLLAKVGAATQANQTSTRPSGPRLPWQPAPQQSQGAAQ